MPPSAAKAQITLSHFKANVTQHVEMHNRQKAKKHRSIATAQSKEEKLGPCKGVSNYILSNCPSDGHSESFMFLEIRRWHL